MNSFTVPIECRADESHEGPGRIVGTILETGRVAADRQEVFVPGSPIFPSTGVTLYRGHRGVAVMRFDPSSPGVRSESTRDSLIQNLVDKWRWKFEAVNGPRSLSSSCRWMKGASWAFASCEAL